MPGDILFLLPARFVDEARDGAAFHCAACVHVEGLLTCYPQLRDVLEIRYVEYARPRDAIAELLGDAHQGCPVIVVADDARAGAPGVQRSASTGRLFVDGSRDITTYCAQFNGIVPAHP